MSAPESSFHLDVDVEAARIYLGVDAASDKSFRNLPPETQDKYRAAARRVAIAALHVATTRLSDERDALLRNGCHLSAAVFRNARECVELVADEIVGVRP